MAFPQIADADTSHGTVTSNSNPWTLTYPTNIQAGDLLVAFIVSDGNSGFSTAGWTQVMEAGVVAVSLACLMKKAVGTETGTFSVDLNASEQGAWRIFRIPAATWRGGSIPNTGTTSCDSDSVSGINRTSQQEAGGPSNQPNPPALNPANWGVEDTLWIAACSADASRTISSYPSNMPDRQVADVSGGSTGATLATCTLTSAVASLDPAVFTISASDDWEAQTVAIRPRRVLPPVIKNLSQDVNRAAVI